LVPSRPGALPPPETRPLGRAALTLGAEGLDVVFGDTVHDGVLHGWVAVPGGWNAVEADVCGFVDRFPSQRRAEHYAEILANLAGKVCLNAPEVTLLCRDKVASQRLLESSGVELPSIVTDPEAFASALSAWGTGFLKPRFGALGVGVRRVRVGDALPAHLPGVVEGRLDPAVLQRAVVPPPGWAGWSVRVLAQRDPDESWVFGHPVVRRSREDPVVNAARGALVDAGADVLPPATAAAVQAAVEEAVAAFDPLDGVVELGLDLVIDSQGFAHLIEVNSRPRGRMEVLAARDPLRFGALHTEALLRPLRVVAARAAR
jgi:glutathione synthase/RimK-type ligase-like ATP-grasp enzyme